MPWKTAKKTRMSWSSGQCPCCIHIYLISKSVPLTEDFNQLFHSIQDAHLNVCTMVLGSITLPCSILFKGFTEALELLGSNWNLNPRSMAFCEPASSHTSSLSCCLYFWSSLFGNTALSGCSSLPSSSSPQGLCRSLSISAQKGGNALLYDSLHSSEPNLRVSSPYRPSLTSQGFGQSFHQSTGCLFQDIISS